MMDLPNIVDELNDAVMTQLTLPTNNQCNSQMETKTVMEDPDDTFFMNLDLDTLLNNTTGKNETGIKINGFFNNCSNNNINIYFNKK